jgi:hypothetical protein
LEISVRAVDLDVIIVVKGHAPEAVVFSLACNTELLPELVGSLIMREI